MLLCEGEWGRVIAALDGLGVNVYSTEFLVVVLLACGGGGGGEFKLWSQGWKNKLSDLIGWKSSAKNVGEWMTLSYPARRNLYFDSVTRVLRNLRKKKRREKIRKTNFSRSSLVIIQPKQS